jgi:DNA modification methylase
MNHTLLIGDALDALATLPDESVHCVITSPPYWGLRDYSTGTWEGGDPGCDHAVRRWGGQKQTQGAQSSHAAAQDRLDRRYCHKCGALCIDRQIGQEPTPQEYVANLTRVFREIRRVLRKDGTCWLNMGDSYAGSRGSQALNGISNSRERNVGNNRGSRVPTGLKPKDLIGLPWMMAFALRDDGWHLRAENIWEKGNPMPESVQDRTTRNHEQVFLLTKSSKTLFWTHPRKQRTDRHPRADHVWTHKRTGLTVDYPPVTARLLREFWTRRNLWKGHDYYYDTEAIKEPLATGSDVAYRSKIRKGKHYDSKEPYCLNFPASFDLTGKNRRSVWHINTAQFKGAHFAVFPPALARICLLAGCPKGGTVLDPLGGAGTVSLVAEQEGRDSIYIDLKPEYGMMAHDRIMAAHGSTASVFAKVIEHEEKRGATA